MPANYPNVPFTEGQTWTPDLAYLSFLAPYFDDQPSLLGHRARISDEELSVDPLALKTRFNNIDGSLKVYAFSGPTVAYGQGQVRLPDGRVVAVAAGLHTLPNDVQNTTIYIDRSGAIGSATTPPVVAFPLALATTVGGNLVSLSDYRSVAVRPLIPRGDSIRTFGGNSFTDETATQGKVYNQGVYFFRDFTVPAGITVSFDRFTKVICSGNVNIAGTANVAAVSRGAVVYLDQVSNIQSPKRFGSGLGNLGDPYPFVAQPFGSGAGSGVGLCISGSAAYTLGQPGSGGGGLWIEAAGRLIISGTIAAQGQAGGASSTTGTNILLSGSGGGSGGLLYLASSIAILLTAAATVNLSGGNGGPAFVNATAGNAFAAGGHGGAGGVLCLFSPDTNYSGATINLNPGLRGSTAFTNPGYYTENGDTLTCTGPLNGIGGGFGAGFGGRGGNETYTANSYSYVTATAGIIQTYAASPNGL